MNPDAGIATSIILESIVLLAEIVELGLLGIGFCPSDTNDKRSITALSSSLLG
jgi:hypothetical protein